MQKATIRLVMSVRPNDTTRFLPDGFSRNLVIQYFFRKSSGKKIEVSLKSDKNNGLFTWHQYTSLTISRSILLRMTLLQVKVVDKIETHIVGPIIFLFENRAVYEIMWINIAQPDRPQMTIWRMRIACWIPKATNTHSEYVTLTAFPLQQWLHESASTLRLYVHFLPCFLVPHTGILFIFINAFCSIVIHLLALATETYGLYCI